MAGGGGVVHGGGSSLTTGRLLAGWAPVRVAISFDKPVHTQRELFDQSFAPGLFSGLGI